MLAISNILIPFRCQATLWSMGPWPPSSTPPRRAPPRQTPRRKATSRGRQGQPNRSSFRPSRPFCTHQPLGNNRRPCTQPPRSALTTQWKSCSRTSPTSPTPTRTTTLASTKEAMQVDNNLRPPSDPHRSPICTNSKQPIRVGVSSSRNRWCLTMAAKRRRTSRCRRFWAADYAHLPNHPSLS